MARQGGRGWLRAGCPWAVLLVSVAATTSCAAHGRTETTGILGASVDAHSDRDVVVTFTTNPAAGCGQYDSADVVEDAPRVTVTIYLRTTARDCTASGMQTRRAVRLSSPLDDRQLVDGSSGQPVSVTVTP